MKLLYKQTDKKPESCFMARRDTLPCLEHDWHFHPELELIYFLKSSGTRFVGNSIGNFEPGELYLIGSNLPHLFRNHKEYYEENFEGNGVDLIVIKFESDFLGKDFADLVEANELKKLFKKANKGLKFSKEIGYLVNTHMMSVIGNNGLSGIIGLLGALNILAVTESYTSLCEEEITNNFQKGEKERMAKIISFLTQNFDKKIELETVSSIACMTPNAFCRYFKKRTKKSFTEYLNEIRLGHACKLLIEGEMQITSVAYLSGFNTITNFNRQFKSFIKMTPTVFMEKYSVKLEEV